MGVRSIIRNGVTPRCGGGGKTPEEKDAEKDDSEEHFPCVGFIVRYKRVRTKRPRNITYIPVMKTGDGKKDGGRTLQYSLQEGY